jgi:hypothetical protein
MQMITPTEHEKREWSRMAADAYAKDRNDIGHRYSAWASIKRNVAIRLDVFDTLQINYRRWLVDNEF